MQKLIQFFRPCFYPSVGKILNTFQKKIDELKIRIDLDVEHINSIDIMIESLQEQQQKLILDVAKAETAIEHLEKITG